MREYRYSSDYNDPLLAELYDRFEKYQDDIILLRQLIGDARPLKILECFSGTGRILIPLAFEGHTVTGIEMAEAMQARARLNMELLNKTARARINLITADVLDGNWGRDYDLVILGANCLYELPDPTLQKQCVGYAAEALKPGGIVYIDNDAYHGNWANGPFGEETVIFQGTSSDGTYGRYSMKHLSFDLAQSVLKMERTLYKRSPDGQETVDMYIGRKHPVAAQEVEGWLHVFRFEIVKLLGTHRGDLYTPQSPRAIFWARKKT
jgi:SAM-dependent methyltransferase